MLGLRILTGVLAVPLLLLIAFDDGWLFKLGVVAAGLIGTGEALWMAAQAGYRPLSAFSLLLALAILGDAALSFGLPSGPFALPPLTAGQLLAPALGVAALGSLAVLMVRPSQHGAINDWALTLALPIYVAGLLRFFFPLRYAAGSGLLTWPAIVLVVSWSCDIAAYAVGRLLGRVRLAPQISPAKSVEGAVAGVVAAALVTAGLFRPTGQSPLLLAGLGLAIGVGSVVGDLAESLLKRQCGVKDSGFLMPGHGGLLDRMDALLGAAACAYFYLQAVL